MNDCAWRQARAWALGLLAGALAVAILALGIAGAIRLDRTSPNRVCAKGHDVDPGPSASDYPYFVCDLWVPKAGAGATSGGAK